MRHRSASSSCTSRTPSRSPGSSARSKARRGNLVRRADEKRTILQQLTEAEGFEAFCQKRYVTTKRFGLEGGEVTIPALHAIIETAAADGVNEIAIGMPHRGRLNTLVNIVKKPLTALFSEFGGESFKPDDVQGSGDVKYHLGTSTDVEVAGHSVHLSLQPNPSHLEAVDPVVVGKVRARQDQAGDTQRRSSVMAILMHGDAAFAGQGLVYETLAMSQLIGYRTGGTVHLIVNNQIGFTTVPAHAYSGLYCTDVAKSIQAPILHVNGDDPEAVIFCARMAAEFRMRFGSDIVLDIVCYRRHGHNETDEPAFTQPLMYRAIDALKTTRTLYAEKLARRGRRSADEAKAMWDEFTATLEDAEQRGEVLQAEQGRLAGRPLGRLSHGGGGGRAHRGDHRRSMPTVLKQIGAALVARAGRTSTSSRRSPASSRPSGRCSISAGRTSTGPPARRWRSARCCWKAAACACRARTASAARSASATRC